jgi:hypothetical protein
MNIEAGKQHGKRDCDGYVCTHGICADCKRTIWKLRIGNEAGRRYAVPMIQNAITEHHCGG